MVVMVVLVLLMVVLVLVVLLQRAPPVSCPVGSIFILLLPAIV